VNGNEAILSKFGETNPKNTVFEVDIIAIQASDFTRA
jgi:hypothetical protein